MIRWIILAKEPDCRAGVVLPDDSTGQSPGSLAIKLSRCEESTAQFLLLWHKFYRMQARLPRASEASDGGRGTNFIVGTVIITGDGLYKLHWRSIALAPYERSE
jgi:hypothetical protein